MINIIHVEDDRSFAEYVKDILENEFTTRGIIIKRVATELEFREKVHEIATCPPTLVLIDIMLRWCDARPDFEEPPLDVKQGGCERAGIRCQKLLFRMKPDVHVVFYTVLEPSDMKSEFPQMPRNVVYINKGADIQDLIDKIREIAATSAGISTP